MIKYTALIVIIAIRMFYHPSSVNSMTEPFSAPVIPATPAISTPANTNDANGRDKVFYKWILIQNEWEEKLCFAPGMVFGIEKPQTGYSLFINQSMIQKMFFRIGILNKSRATTC